jgi:tetratricopeptide (TPR) repeat protein
MACSLLTVLSLCVAAQDLGSSNKLFGTPKTSKPATKTTSKKSGAKKPATTVATKSKPTTAKSKPKPSTTTAKTAKPAARPVVATVKPETNKVVTEPKVETVAKPSTQAKPYNAPISAATSELFEKLIEDGNTARDERNYDAAEAAYVRAKSIKSTDARALYGLGNLYSDQQRWDDAETAYRSALEIDPKSATIRIALSYVLSQPLFVSNLSDRYDVAERMARRAIELAPSNALGFDQLGVAMELRGLISKETEDAYRNAIRLDPAFAPAYAHLGRLLRRRGLIKESDSAYKDAIRLATDVGTMVVVAEVMQSEQRIVDSEKLLQRAVDEDPRNAAALLLLGRALTTLGKYSDAERVLRRSLDVSSKSFMGNLLLGELFTRQKKYEQGENALLQALRFVPESEKRRLSQQFEGIGDGYLKRGKADAAERVYKQAMLLDPEKESLAGKIAKTQHG